MKIILSRKGFDSTNGGFPSPIMPDGTLLSMPIPSDDKDSFDDLEYAENKYSDILKQLLPNKSFNSCHVDPDIRDNNRKLSIDNWKAAFGQSGAAQGVLQKAGVERGDIFLFFGWFRQAEVKGGHFRFVSRDKGDFYEHSDLQIIYGYMQIGDILLEKDRISEYPWHPHASESTIEDQTNALYIPTERLSLLPECKGYGTLDYREDRVLTMKDKSRAVWNEYSFLMPEHVYGNRKNSAKGSGLYYAGIWQEMVVYESDGLIEWVKSIIS